MKLFSTFSALTTFVAISFASQVSDVTKGFVSITAGVQGLDNLVKGFPASGGSLNAALAIHGAAVNLIGTVDHATEDVKNVNPKPFAEGDAQGILNQARALQPIIKQTLIDVVAKKNAFGSLPVGGITALVHEDLVKLSASTQQLEAGLLSQTPADLHVQAEGVIASIDASFAGAIAAYA